MSQNTKLHLTLIDYVRALAMVQIILYHWWMEFFKGSFLPVVGTVQENLQRIMVFGHGSFLQEIGNLLSFLVAYGFGGVPVFVILSGFVLTYAFADRVIDNWSAFLWKRIVRLWVPFYLSLLFGIGFLFLRNWLFPAVAAMPVYTWIDFLKITFLPFFLLFDVSLLQKFNGDYWFIPLILQVSLAFPVLLWLLKKIGTRWFLIVTLFLTFVWRFFATYYWDSAPLGVIYQTQNGYLLFTNIIPRLFEFTFGMWLGWWQLKKDVLGKMVGIWPLIGGFVTMLAGAASYYFLIGWLWSDALFGIGLLIVMMNLGAVLAKNRFLEKGLRFLSLQSYDLYLTHHYLMNYLIWPFIYVMGLWSVQSFWLFMPLFVIGAFALAQIELKIGAWRFKRKN